MLTLPRNYSPGETKVEFWEARLALYRAPNSTIALVDHFHLHPYRIGRKELALAVGLPYRTMEYAIVRLADLHRRFPKHGVLKVPAEILFHRRKRRLGSVRQPTKLLLYSLMNILQVHQHEKVTRKFLAERLSVTEDRVTRLLGRLMDEGKIEPRVPGSTSPIRLLRAV